MAVGTGIGFDFSKLDAQFKKLDDELTKLTQKGQAFSNIFANMGTQGLTNFTTNLTNLRKQVVDFGKSQRNLVNWDSTSLKNHIDNVNRLIYVIKSAQKETKSQGIKGLSIQGLRKELKEAQELLRLVKSAEKSAATATTNRNQSYRGAVSYSNRVKTLEQERQAVKNLEAAREKLRKTDANYQKKLDELNTRIRQHNRNIKDATKGAKELSDSHNEVIGTAGKLSRALAAAFSVQAIRGYVNNLIKVRGEFELQQRSLQALLQSKDDADRLWQQTIDLAVKSPFRIKELVSYTKQLAAYQIESEKLFETNKMLADVSAGLGVDMQRLILAFGQVKAANFLRGTELRQFTEAGVPMLEELAKHFSELEGTAVSVGDVFERISKRMVSFSDVEAVFRNITSAGGDFYRMQEIQSETLKGQISNLKDSIDIMLNSVGKSTEGALKRGVGAVKSLVDNWQLVAKSIEGVIAVLAMYKLQAALVSKNMIALANTLGVINDKAATQITLQQLLKVGWRSLINPIKNAASTMYNFAAAHPVLLAVTAAVAGLLKIWRQWGIVNNNIENFAKQLNEAKRAANELSVAFQFGDTSEQRSSLLSLIGLANREYKMKIGLDADSIKDMDTSELEAKFVKIREAIFDANAFAYSFAEAMEKDAFKQWLGNLIDDDVFEDIDDFGKRAEQLDAQVRNSMKSIVASVLDSGVTLDDYQKQLLESLTIPKDVNESNFRYVENLEKAFKELSGVFKSAGVDVDDTRNAFRRFRRTAKEVTKEFNDFAESFKIDSSLSNDQKAYQLKFAIDKLGFEKEWGDFELDLLYRLAEEKFNITIGVQAGGASQTLDPWANRVYDAISEVNEKIKKDNPDFKGGLFPLPQVGQTKEQYVAAAKAVIDVAKATYNDIQQIEEDSTVQRTKALSPYVTEVEKILNLFRDSGRDKGRDEVLEKLKNRINLIKEMNKEYEKLNKTFSEAESLAKVQKAYADTAKELGLDTSTMDFTDEGTIKSLEALLGKPEYAANKYVIELQKALDNFKVELGIEVKQDADKQLNKEIEDLFEQYELTIDLKKLNLPKGAAEQLFDTEYLDLEGLRKAVTARANEFVGTEQAEQYKKFLEKIDEMERKDLVERTKKYLEYAKMTIGERAKIKIEELTKLKEIEDTFEIKSGDDEETVAYKKDMRLRAGLKAREEAQKALQSLEWDEFQKTDTFTSLFDDIDNASDALVTHMITKLRDFKEEWKDMPLEDVKTIVGKLNELESTLAERSPWEAYRNAKEAVKNARENAKYSFESEDARNLYGKGKSDKDFIAALQIENAYQEEKVAKIKEEMAVVEEMISLKEGTLPYEINVLDYSKQQMRYAAMTKEQLRDLLKDKKKEVEVANAIVLDNGQILVQYKNQEKSLKKQAEVLGEVQKMANDLYDAFTELTEALGADSDSPAAIFADMGMNMMNAVLNTIMLQAQLKAVEVGAYAAGTAINTAMGVIGWIVMGVQLLTAGIKAIAKINDNKIVAQLEEQAEIIERQRDIYEQIEEKVEKAYSSDQLRQYNKELERSVELEIQALEASIALEKSRKKADEEQIKKYEEEIADARKRLAESTQEMMEELGGIFDLTDFASGFVDAWWEAMEEGMNGLDALNEHFDEVMVDMVKKQALYAGASKIMEQLQNAINAGLEKDYAIDESEWDAIVAAAKKANIDLDAFLQGYRDLFGELSMSGGAGLSALQKGVQGVTEQTAQVIEAYLNSVRMYVATISADTTSQLNEVKAIHRLLESVTLGGHSRGGVGFKVFMD